MLNKADKYLASLLGFMLTVSACQPDESLSIPGNQGKTAIELSVGTANDVTSITRSVVTSAGSSAKPFDQGTSIYLVLKSENSNDTEAVSMYTRTIGYAEGAEAGNKNVKFNSTFGRFWEDSYSRNSQLSAFALCVPNNYLAKSVFQDAVESGTIDETVWTIGNSDKYDNVWAADKGVTTINWPLRGKTAQYQDGAFVNSQDLCFSNNVSDLGTEDRRVMFDQTHKKFGSGLMYFYHALSRVTFKIKKGEGFEKDEKFEFSNNDENIVLEDFFTSGTFDIAQGEFTNSTLGTVSELAITARNTSDGFAFVLDGLMLPGTKLDDATTDKIYFTINYNLYQLPKKTLYDALEGAGLTTDGKMRPGVHYVFTMTVGKKKMDNFTAAVVDWETVESDEMEPTNARITMTLLEKGVQKKGAADFDLFRASNYNEGVINDNFKSYAWETGYTLADNKARLIEATSNSGIYAAEEALAPHTSWYWPDNKTFYHFRTVMPKTDDEWEVKSTSNSDDYITLTAGFSGSYRDVCWGAPFAATTEKLTYDTDSKGFDGKGEAHQLSMAIGPTKSAVNMMMFHMMSDATIRLTTTDGDDKVDLNNAKMELSNIHTSGKVMMGNGRVIPDDGINIVNNVVSETENQNPWHYGFVPQSLKDVKLTITTADNNLYIVNMEEVLATTVGDNIISNSYTKSGSKYMISRWLPNYRYIYTFKLSKAGITKITASLAPWDEVEAGDDNVQIQ